MLVDAAWLAARLGDHYDDVVPYVQPTPGPGVFEPIAATTPVDTKLPAVRPFTYDAPSSYRPDAARLERSLRAHGVSRDHTIVVYDRDHNIWAARLWWLIRAHGHADVVVLDGGWRAWTLAAGPVTREVAPVTPGDFAARPEPGWWAERAEVLAATRDEATCLLSAQTSVQYEGLAAASASPGGRIPGSVNVHARTLTDPDTQRFLARPALVERLDAAGALRAPHAIAYCGAGIAAAGTAFALRLLGAADVRVFDGGMSEWVAAGDLPVERGAVPGLEHTAASRGADG